MEGRGTLGLTHAALENAAETLVSSRGGDDEEIEAALVELCNLCQERSSFN